MKNKILLIVTSILLVIFFVIGTSYALWLVSSEQIDNNVAGTECFDISFTENSEEIVLTNTFPISDSKGMESEPFTFTITNTCEMDASYQVNLELLNTTTLDHSLLKVVLDNNTPSIVSDLTVVEGLIENATAYKFNTYLLAAGDSSIHDLRMWLDYSATLENSQYKDVYSKITIVAAPENPLYPSYVDAGLNGASPAFMSNMIPVVNNIIANVDDAWYDYESGELANVMLTTQSDAKTYNNIIGENQSVISNLGEYVWIPRFKYDSNGIVFESSDTPKSTGDGISTYKTHEAFTQDGVELDGFWVSKYFLSNDSNTVSLDETSLLYSVSGSAASMYSTNSSSTYDDINDFNDHIDKLNASNSYELPSSYEIHGMSLEEESAMKIFAEYYNTNDNNEYEYDSYPYDTSVQVDSNGSGIHNVIENDYVSTIAYDSSVKKENGIVLVSNKEHFENITPKVEFINNDIYNGAIEKVVDPGIEVPEDEGLDGSNNVMPEIDGVTIANESVYGCFDFTICIGDSSTYTLVGQVNAIDGDGDIMTYVFPYLSFKYFDVTIDASSGVFNIYFKSNLINYSNLYEDFYASESIPVTVRDSNSIGDTENITITITGGLFVAPEVLDVSFDDSSSPLNLSGNILTSKNPTSSNGYNNLFTLSSVYKGVTTNYSSSSYFGVGSFELNEHTGDFSYDFDYNNLPTDFMYDTGKYITETYEITVKDKFDTEDTQELNITIDSFGYRGHRAVIVEK